MEIWSSKNEIETSAQHYFDFCLHSHGKQWKKIAYDMRINLQDDPVKQERVKRNF